MRSHPPSLIKIVERTLKEECALEPGEHVMVAASGGSDSTALLHVLARLAPQLDFRLSAHGVDHGLRDVAGAELDLVERLAERLGVSFQRTRLDVSPGGNLQARARDARHAALLRARDATGASRIATAHHAGDRAETVLIRLLSGASVSALGVLPATDGAFLRPLIRAPKTAVLAHLERHGLEWARDPSNEDRRFLRVRVRHEVIPLLEALSPTIVDHLNGLADELVGPLAPPVTDGAGRPLTLRRAHAKALRRALTLGLGARIRLPGDREIVVEPYAARAQPAGIAEVRVAPARPIDRPRLNGQKGGAKSEKRG